MDKKMPTEIIIDEGFTNEPFYSLESISPYDDSFPIKMLSSALDRKKEQANKIVKSVYESVIREASVVAQTEQAMKKGYRYVVDVTESTLEAIESGKIKLTTEKNGQTYAQIRQANGQYGSKLPIKREEFAKGIDTVQMANAMQMQALQVQLKVIENQIYAIDHNVKDVLQGQQNDRIGLYYSGAALFLEAQNVYDEQMKKQLIAQALRSLSDATFQLSLTLKDDIKYLVNGEYKGAKGKRVELIEKKIQNIHQSFAYIHQSAMLRTAIYCEQNEIGAMTTVLGEYSRFIEGTIAKNARLLAQCDVNDNGSDSGIWNRRANLKLDVADFAKKIKSPEKTLYLGVELEEE